MSEVNLWFARNSKNEIITIDKVDKSMRDEYSCPICGSEVIPKAIKDDAVMSSHFAHRDREKCTNEHLVHWWSKNKLLEKGSEIKFFDQEVFDYTCKKIFIEQEHKTSFGIYKPDITVITDKDEKVFIEVAYRNKKKIEDYHDMWLELGCIVIEVRVDGFNYNKDNYKALFVRGEYRMVNHSESEYVDIVGDYKEKIYKNKINNKELENLKLLDWFWKDVVNYKTNNIPIDEIIIELDNIEDKDLKETVIKVLNQPKCNTLVNDILEYRIKMIKNWLERTKTRVKLDFSNKRKRIYMYTSKNKLNRRFYFYETLMCIKDYINKLSLMLKKFDPEEVIFNKMEELELDYNIEFEGSLYLNNIEIKLYYNNYILPIKLYKKQECRNRHIREKIDEQIKKQKLIDLEKRIKKFFKNKYVYVDTKTYGSINKMDYVFKQEDFVRKISISLDSDLNIIEGDINRSFELEKRIRLFEKKFRTVNKKSRFDISSYECTNFSINDELDIRVYDDETCMIGYGKMCIEEVSIKDVLNCLDEILSKYLRYSKYTTRFNLNDYKGGN